jgi:hypothetical protein
MNAYLIGFDCFAEEAICSLALPIGTDARRSATTCGDSSTRVLPRFSKAKHRIGSVGPAGF